MSSSLHLETGAPGNGADDVGFDLDGSRRGNRCRQLRIESRRNTVGALGWKRRCGIEETEIPRVRHVNAPVLQLRDSPCQQPVHRPWRAKIKAGKLAPEPREVECRHYATFGYAPIGNGQLPCQQIVPALTGLARRK